MYKKLQYQLQNSCNLIGQSHKSPPMNTRLQKVLNFEIVTRVTVSQVISIHNTLLIHASDKINTSAST